MLIEQRVIFERQLARKRRPKGFCYYCNLAIAPQEPNEEENNIIFHTHCWDKYNRLKQAKKELLALIPILDTCTRKKNILCPKEVERLSTIEQARRFLILLIERIKTNLANLKKKAIHLMQELNKHLQRVATLLRLEGLELGFLGL